MEKEWGRNGIRERKKRINRDKERKKKRGKERKGRRVKWERKINLNGIYHIM